jgi:hypothetical protein
MSVPASRPRSLSTSATCTFTSSTTDKSLQFLLSRILLDLKTINTHLTTLETTVTTTHAHLSHTLTSLETSLYSTNALTQQQSAFNQALTDSLEILIRRVSDACVAECVRALRALEAEHHGMVENLGDLEEERKVSERVMEAVRGAYKTEHQKVMKVIEEFQGEEKRKWMGRRDRVLDAGVNTVVSKLPWELGRLALMVFVGWAIGRVVRLVLVGGCY